METTNFNSPHIKYATYDDITHQLYIRLQNGEYYVYYDVIPVDYVGFLSAEDHSNYIETRLEMKYDKRQLF